MLDLNQYLVREHIGFMKLSDTFDIVNPQTTEVVGIARENISGFMKFLRLIVNRQMLPTKVEIIEKPDLQGNGNVILTIKRGMTLLRSKVSVFGRDGRELGFFKSKIFTLGGGFWIYGTNGEQVAEIKGDWKGWDFKLLDKSGRELGTVTKKWTGFGKELFTSADNYMVAIKPEYAGSTELKSLLLCACLAIDIVFKEQS